MSPAVKRLVDLARRDRGVELLVEREFRKLNRIVGRRERARRIDAARQAETAQDGEPQRQRRAKA